MNTDKIYAEKLASEYAPKENNKVVALKKLDMKAKQMPKILALSLGIVSSLIFGTGMCFCMGQIGDGSLIYMILGVALGVVGAALAVANWFIYKKLIENGKKKYGNDIIRLAKEITEE